MGLDGFNYSLDTLHDCGKISFRVQGVQTVIRAVAGQGGHLGTFDQGFGRHTAGVKAVAAHAIFFHQGDASLDGGADISAHQTAGAGADNDQIAVKMFGLFPAAIDLRTLQGRE